MTRKKHQRLLRTVPTARGATTACDVRGPLAGGSADVQPASTFDCANWPACGCPDGAVSHDCPALKRMVAERRFQPIAAPEKPEKPTPIAIARALLCMFPFAALIIAGALVAAMIIGAVIALVF